MKKKELKAIIEQQSRVIASKSKQIAILKNEQNKFRAIFTNVQNYILAELQR